MTKLECGVYLKVGRDKEYKNCINYGIITSRINLRELSSFYLIILGTRRLSGGSANRHFLPNAAHI